MSLLAPMPQTHRRLPEGRAAGRAATCRVSDLPLQPFQAFEGHLELGELISRWRLDGDAPAVIEERGLWIGLLDPQDLKARLEAGQERRRAREVLSPDLDYCFHDTDASDAAEFANATGAAWVGVLDDEGRLIGLVEREALARAAEGGAKSSRSRRRRHGGPEVGHAA